MWFYIEKLNFTGQLCNSLLDQVSYLFTLRCKAHVENNSIWGECKKKKKKKKHQRDLGKTIAGLF
jgi:hypothetical protein